MSATENKDWPELPTGEYVQTAELNKKKTIYAISDLHLEHYRTIDALLEKVKFPVADILVLAGDIGDPIKDKINLVLLLNYLRPKYEHVIIVAGNHEYYGCNKNRALVIPSLRNVCKAAGVHLLDRDVLVLEGIRFIGATLWSAIDKKSLHIFNDFTYVFDHQVEYLEMFINDYQFIKKALLESLDHEEPVVVITHHLPTNRLIHPRYKDHEANSGFNTNILDLVALHKVKFWFCGHTHEYAETKYGDTKLVVNPVGYPDEIRYTNVKDTVWEL